MTGIDILDKSLPIFLHSKFHKFKPEVSGITAGSFCLRPVIRVRVELGFISFGVDGDSIEANSVDKELLKIKVICKYWTDWTQIGQWKLDPLWAVDTRPILGSGTVEISRFFSLSYFT